VGKGASRAVRKMLDRGGAVPAVSWTRALIGGGHAAAFGGFDHPTVPRTCHESPQCLPLLRNYLWIEPGKPIKTAAGADG